MLGECNSNYFNVWAARHLKLLDEEVQSFNEQLPQRSKLSPGQVATVKSRLYSDLEKVSATYIVDRVVSYGPLEYVVVGLLSALVLVLTTA